MVINRVSSGCCLIEPTVRVNVSSNTTSVLTVHGIFRVVVNTRLVKHIEFIRYVISDIRKTIHTINQLAKTRIFYRPQWVLNRVILTVVNTGSIRKFIWQFVEVNTSWRVKQISKN